jgi:hypothetical protein
MEPSPLLLAEIARGSKGNGALFFGYDEQLTECLVGTTLDFKSFMGGALPGGGMLWTRGCDTEDCMNIAHYHAGEERGGCWLWMGRKGHGRSWHDAPHWVEYELRRAGRWSDGARWSTTCGNRNCVNPAHIVAHSVEITTRAKNGPYGALAKVVSVDNGCVIWTGATINHETPVVGKDYKFLSKMVAMYHGREGRDEKYESVCGSKKCMNPEHWYVRGDKEWKDRVYARYYTHPDPPGKLNHDLFLRAWAAYVGPVGEPPALMSLDEQYAPTYEGTEVTRVLRPEGA